MRTIVACHQQIAEDHKGQPSAAGLRTVAARDIAASVPANHGGQNKHSRYAWC